MPSVRQIADICVPLQDHPAYQKRKLRVATIGAGFSGLILAHKIQHEQPELQDFIEHVIFEKNDGESSRSYGRCFGRATAVSRSPREKPETSQ